MAVNYPEASEVLVSFPDQWELIGKIWREDTPLYISAMPLSEETSRREQFYDLPSDVNLSLTPHRQYKLFQPWPTPSVIVSWDETTGTGRVEKMRSVGEGELGTEQLG